MAMINQDKPNTSGANVFLTIGSGFRLLVGSLYNLVITPGNGASFTNQSKPTTALANSAKAVVEPIWGASVLPWQLPLPWLVNESGITNQTKP